MPKLVSVLIITLFLSVDASAKVRAGYWQDIITPGEEEALTSCLGGYGDPFSRCGTSDVHTDIWVRTLALSDYNTDVVMAVLDTVGVGDSLIRDIKDAAYYNLYGLLHKDDIFIVATHTHSGPDLQGIWGGVSDDYRQRIVDTVARSIAIAYSNRTRVKVYTSNSEVDVENRRGWDLVDKNLNVLDFRSKRFGHSVATLINMSAHPTIIDENALVYSSDYVGSLRSTYEQSANTNVIFINGILGDAQPVTSLRTPQEADDFGRDSALAALEAMRFQKKANLNGGIKRKTIHFSHKVENPLILGAVQAGLLDLDVDADLNINTRASLLEIGKDISALMFPGESLSRLGIPIKNQLDTRTKMFFGLADDSLGYFIPSDEYLSIPGRTTEEAASLSPLIGDSIRLRIEFCLLQHSYHEDCFAY